MSARDRIHAQDLARLEEEKASLKKTILWDLRQRVESCLSDTRDIDPNTIESKSERILVRHLQDIDHIISNL